MGLRPCICCVNRVGYLNRPFGAFFLLVMIILGAQVALKKPLCIDSNIVYKIDRTVSDKNENIYSCSQFKKVSFSRFFHERLDLIENQIRKAEIALRQLNMSEPMQIRIVPASDLKDTTEPASEFSHTVLISEESLSSGGLPRAMIETALRYRTGSKDRDYIAALRDFVSRDMGGDEHPHRLISQAWSASLQSQDLFEKRRFLQRIAPQLQSSYEPAQDAIFNLHKLLRLNSESGYLADAFTQQLEKRGYISNEELSGRRFDVIVEITGRGQKQLAAELLALAREAPEMKLAFKTADGLFLLPSVLRVPDDIAENLYAEYRLIFTEKSIRPQVINSHLQNSERLVFVEKSDDIPLNLKPLFRSGVTGFLSANPQLNFVQMHLPSYRLKSSALNGVRDYFSFVREHAQQKKEHRALGWQKSEWLKDLKAYRPLAHFDVIQYFRIN